MTDRERDEHGDEAGRTADEPGLDDKNALGETDILDTDESVRDEDLDEDVDEALTDKAAVAPPRRGVARPAARQAGAVPAEAPPRVTDRASSWFVIAAIAVFILILLNGTLFGHGGALSPTPTPEPSASITASPSASPGGSASPSGSASASTSPSAASPSGSASPSPSGSPTSPSPSASSSPASASPPAS